MSRGLFATSSFARPANTTAYAQYDLVANDATAGSVVVPYFATYRYGELFEVVAGRLIRSQASVTNSAFRVHLFKGAAPVPTVGDNAAFNSSETLATTEATTYLGSLAFAAADGKIFSTSGASGFGKPLLTGERIFFVPGAEGSKLYWLLEAQAAYAPASGETFSLEVYAIPYGKGS
jgi:hypothetical protein